MTTVFGIDPGLADTGIGLVSGSGLTIHSFSYGSINTSRKASTPSRLDQIYTKITAAIETQKPDLLVVEDVFSLEKYPKSGIVLGKVSGVILLAGHRFGLPVLEIPVREAKQVLTGNGNASKDQLEKAVRHQLQLKTPIRPFHSSDALALALIGLYRFSR